MISVAEAKNIVLNHCSVLDAVEIAMIESVGYTLAQDIVSTIDIPSFRQSSMDGYAIRFTEMNHALRVQDELPAGTPKQISLQPLSAIKVFTGGPVPEGADTVVQKEKVTLQDNVIQINAPDVLSGANIRLPGAEISKGITAISSGTVIQTMHIGFLASLGITSVKVTRRPRVALIITGNELVQPGNALSPGQIYESNSFGLKACLQQLHINRVTVTYVKDNLRETESTIVAALNNHDLVLLTGGVSVGEHDHVANACVNIGIQKQFHGVKQRPGKPLFFGTKHKQLVFGLPGNPASVLSCFYQYVMPAIRHMSGTKDMATEKSILSAHFEKKIPLTFFLKGFAAKGEVEVLSGQASFQLSPFVHANCWIELEETGTSFEKGTEVNIYPF